jgi:hypothetical protein
VVGGVAVLLGVPDGEAPWDKDADGDCVAVSDAVAVMEAVAVADWVPAHTRGGGGG